MTRGEIATYRGPAQCARELRKLTRFKDNDFSQSDERLHQAIVPPTITYEPNGMTKRLHAARCISPRTASDAVWITDDILADAFRRFTSVYVRHGSHVPGPLEARRRASKRKNTNLAHLGAPKVDPAILFSKKPQIGWWNEGQVVESKTAVSVLPEWLFGSPEPTHVDLSAATTEELDFAGDLACCESPSDLAALLQTHGHDPKLSQTRAEQIYEHVTGQNWPASHYAQYLTEPALHLPGYSYHPKFLRSFKDKVSSPQHSARATLQDWDTVFEATCKSIRLGLLSPKEWMEAVDATFSIQHALSEITGRSLAGDRVISPSSATLALLDSLEQSAVLSLNDVNPHWLTQLSARLLDCDLDRNTFMLLHRLHGEDSLCHIVDLYVSLLRRHGTDLKATVCADALLQLPRVLLLRTVAQVTNFLTIGILDKGWDPFSLSVWAKALQSFNSVRSTRFELSRKEILHLRHVQTLSLERPQRGVLLLWTLHQIFRDVPAQLGKFNCFRMLDRIFKLHGLRNGTDFQSELLITLDTLPLPHKECLLADLPRILRSQNTWADPVEPTIGQISILRGDIGYLADDATYYTMRRYRLNSLTEAAERVNEDLDKFKRLSQHLIHTNKYAFRIVTRILRHNVAFKTALSFAWPQRLEWQRRKDASVQDSLMTRRMRLLENPKPYLDPQQVLNVTNAVAMAFAVSPAVGHRTALERVLWCYKFLSKHNAPIQAPITRALWHAGITRNPNYSDEQLRYILKMVKRVEGSEVAALLMRDPEFRKWRAASLKSVACWRPLRTGTFSQSATTSHRLTFRDLAVSASANILDPLEVEDRKYAQAVEERVTQIMAQQQEPAGKIAADQNGAVDLDSDTKRARAWHGVLNRTRDINPWTVRRSSRSLEEILWRRGWHKKERHTDDGISSDSDGDGGRSRKPYCDLSARPQERDSA